MENYLIEIFDKAETEQKENWSPICPRCGNFQMRHIPAENSFSRYMDIYICSVCGTDEALRDATKKPIRLSEWSIVRKALEGKTFLDYLCNVKELECELIVDNSDMPATFVWDGENPLTVYGAKYYGALLEAPYRILENGNIEIFCDDYELGKHFTLAAAGHIGQKEYRKLFGHMELERENLTIDRELILEDDGVSAQIQTWFDVNEKFEIHLEDNQSVNFYALYHPEVALLWCTYIIKDPIKDTKHEYYPTLGEADLIKSMMEEVCKKENGCGLLDLWRNKNASEN